MLAEPFVVADGAPGAGDPGEGPLSHPPAAQPHEGVRGGAFDHLHGQLQACRRPGQQPARVAAVGPGQDHGAAAGAQPHRGAVVASRSWTEAAVITVASSRPASPPGRHPPWTRAGRRPASPTTGCPPRPGSGSRPRPRGGNARRRPPWPGFHPGSGSVGSVTAHSASLMSRGVARRPAAAADPARAAPAPHPGLASPLAAVTARPLSPRGFPWFPGRHQSGSWSPRPHRRQRRADTRGRHPHAAHRTRSPARVQPAPEFPNRL
jgi:hypothetical protein